MYLVLLALEPPEETADAIELEAVALNHQALVLGRQILPRHVERDVELLRRSFHLRELRLVVRLGPWLHCPLPQGFRPIGHDQVHVELDDVAEAMARGAGAERIVEREEPGLRVFVGDAAPATLEALAEHMARHRPRILAGNLQRKGRAAALRVGGLDRVGQTRALIAVDLHPIHDHLQHRPAGQRAAVQVFEGDRPVIHEQPPEAAPRQTVDRGADRVSGGRRLVAPQLALGRAQRQAIVLELRCVGFVEPGRRDGVGQRHDRHIEADQQARAR